MDISYLIAKNNFGSTPIIISNSISIFLISLVIAIILGTILYFTFMSKDNEFKFSGFLGKLYSFLTFDSFIFEDALRLLYVLGASFLTVYGLCLLFVSPVFAFVILVGCNLGLRLTFEFFISLFRIKDSRTTYFNNYDFDDDDLDCDYDCNHCYECYDEADFEECEKMSKELDEKEEIKVEENSNNKKQKKQ